MLALAFAAGGCSNASESPSNGASNAKVAEPVTQVFDYAPEGATPQAKAVFDDALIAKGSVNLKYAPTFQTAVTIANNQTVTYSTSNGSAGVDTVIALFMRCDNSTNYDSPFTERPCITTLAINDDFNGLYSQITYRNTSGTTQNAHLMVFAYSNSTGTADLTGFGTISAVAGSIKVGGNAGSTWTSGSVPTNGGTGDPWLFTFDTAGINSNGAYNDDTSLNPVNRESTIGSATSAVMWHVVSGFNSGTTNVNF